MAPVRVPARGKQNDHQRPRENPRGFLIACVRQVQMSCAGWWPPSCWPPRPRLSGPGNPAAAPPSRPRRWLPLPPMIWPICWPPCWPMALSTGPGRARGRHGCVAPPPPPPAPPAGGCADQSLIPLPEPSAGACRHPLVVDDAAAAQWPHRSLRPAAAAPDPLSAQCLPQ